MKNLNYLMNHNLYQIFKRLFSIYIIYIKEHLEKTVNPAIKIYINKTENRIMFKIKTGYYFELFTSATMKITTKHQK